MTPEPGKTVRDQLIEQARIAEQSGNKHLQMLLEHAATMTGDQAGETPPVAAATVRTTDEPRAPAKAPRGPWTILGWLLVVIVSLWLLGAMILGFSQ